VLLSGGGGVAFYPIWRRPKMDALPKGALLYLAAFGKCAVVKIID
jgi:hypothetical protein